MNIHMPRKRVSHQLGWKYDASPSPMPCTTVDDKTWEEQNPTYGEPENGARIPFFFLMFFWSQTCVDII